MYKVSSDPGCSHLRSFAPRRVGRACESESAVGANLGERARERRREEATMVSSASSQESRVRAGERALRATRPRHGPYGNRAHARRLPHSRLTNAVAEDVVEESEGAVTGIGRGVEGLEIDRRDADRSVHTQVGAAEDDDDDDEVCQVRGVTPSRTIVRSGKNALTVTDSEGDAMVEDANVTQQEVLGETEDSTDELCVDTTPAQGLICPEVQATEEEPARPQSPHELRVESIASQIRLLERHVRTHKARTNSLKLASDARLARTAWIKYPRGCDRKTRNRLINAQTKTLLHYKNLLKAKKAEQKHLLHGIPPSAAMRKVLASKESQKVQMVTALVKLILA